MSDLVYALHRITWPDYERQPGHWATIRLLRTLATHDRVDRLLVADPPRSAAVLARRLRGSGLPLTATVHHTAPLRVRRGDPAGVDAARRTVRRWEAWVRIAARRRGLRRPAVLTVHPLVAGFADLGWAGPVTYHGTDDWLAWEVIRPWWPVYEAAFAEIARRGRAVTGVSSAVVARAGGGVVLPNGIEPSEWRETGPAPGWLDGLPRPRAIYVGTLDRRLDTEALESAHGALGGGTLVLVGPHEDRAHLARVRALPGVVVRGAVDRAELTAAVAACDVGLVPHVRSGLTVAMSPLKAFEYLAAGLPVAGTDLPGLRDAESDRVHLASSPAQFGGAVRAALGDGRLAAPARLAWIERNSWARRHEDLLDVALRTRA